MFQTPSNQVVIFFLAIVSAFVALVSFLLWYFKSILSGGVGRALNPKDTPKRTTKKDEPDPPVL